MITTVVDASVMMAWLFEEGEQARVAAAFVAVQRGEAAAPVLLYFEMRNVLLVAERRGRITREQSVAFLNRLATLGIQMERPNGGEAMTLARTHNLTFYDAAYLELARREGLQLATLDRALEKAAITEGVALLGA